SCRGGPVKGEFEAIDRIRALLPDPAPGEIGIGDDAAVAPSPREPWTLLAVDTVVAGVHADLTLVGVDALGWKAVASNVSDIAAMGGRPARCVVSVAGPTGTDLDALYRGVAEAARALDCPVVGGDLVSAPTLVVTVAVEGTVDGVPLRRSGARPGDVLWITGPLGASAAGLRALRAGSAPPGLRAAHERPQPKVAEGLAARRAGATAMIDVSDGLAADLWHLAEASGVGFELDRVPIAAGATEDEALSGGEDYQLVFSAPADASVREAFTGLAPPAAVGRCTATREGRYRGTPLGRLGWQHAWR
ncbi:MAG TPA: thiamine-phosphate kinase, partial [Acidimicrobiales bacterium]|nr:thiamine-phosphate kinase [Acidimicrobiales bacterium]